LAEDNIVNQRLAVRLLEKMGHSVVVADNGKNAIEEFRKGNFDIILMDVQMPEMDGLSATREIRQFELDDGGHIPIIAMTAHAMKGDKQACFDAGMDSYLAKPFKAEGLLKVIEEVLK
jgi:CheY-like chemotaxis protein